jgi:hypothetical protein
VEEIAVYLRGRGLRVWRSMKKALGRNTPTSATAEGTMKRRLLGFLALLLMALPLPAATAGTRILLVAHARRLRYTRRNAAGTIIVRINRRHHAFAPAAPVNWPSHRMDVLSPATLSRSSPSLPLTPGRRRSLSSPYIGGFGMDRA